MTLKEIENTLELLYLRHENLTEKTLITLLKAGGWDEKMVRDALGIHRHIKSKKKTGDSDKQVFLPETQEEPVLPVEIAPDHLLAAQNPGSDVELPVSLVESIEVVQVRENEDPPHNLPLKPYDSAPHVWSFERYKSIFYGDVPKHEEGPKATVSIVPAEHHNHTHVTVELTPLSKDEMRIVVLATVMLLFIILLLGYMYANGRL